VEEVEHILTDLIFIKDGRIALESSMEAVEQRYIEVMAKPDRADAARALGPMFERELFGRYIFLFDGIDRKLLAGLGELRTPNVADLFVATMKRGES